MITQETKAETKFKEINDSRDQNILVGEFKSGLSSLKNSLDRNSKKKRDVDRNFEQNASICTQILKKVQDFSDTYAMQIGI